MLRRGEAEAECDLPEGGIAEERDKGVADRSEIYPTRAGLESRIRSVLFRLEVTSRRLSLSSGKLIVYCVAMCFGLSQSVVNNENDC